MNFVDLKLSLIRVKNIIFMAHPSMSRRNFEWLNVLECEFELNKYNCNIRRFELQWALDLIILSAITDSLSSYLVLFERLFLVRLFSVCIYFSKAISKNVRVHICIQFGKLTIMNFLFTISFAEWGTRNSFPLSNKLFSSYTFNDWNYRKANES